jgi:hypothetical protein
MLRGLREFANASLPQCAAVPPILATGIGARFDIAAITVVITGL